MSDGAAVPPALPEVHAPPSAPARRRLSLGLRTALLSAAIAALAVIVAGLVAFPLVRQAAALQARDTLASQADLVADVLQRRIAGEPGAMQELRRAVAGLQGERIEGYITQPGALAPAPVTEADVLALASGERISDVRETTAGEVNVEGRPLGQGLGLVLVQPVTVSSGPATAFIVRIGFALVAGLLLASLVGFLAARRVTRPLRRAASAAERLAAGERDVRLVPEGPQEVAEMATALNRLAGALAVSENRQRQFLLSVSHELRTPLTAVKGYAEALGDGVVPPDDVARTGRIVAVEADRLERLVADLLDLSRADAVDLRLDVTDVDLGRFGRDAATVWADRCAREGVLFHAELPEEGGAPVCTDPVRLRQIVDNLAENALRVTPAGAPVVLSVRDEGATFAVEVRDGGPGLTNDDVDVAFQPAVLYARYRGVRRVGTGVGLALVGRLAGRLGGTAEAGSAPEGGARFTVRLPRRRST